MMKCLRRLCVVLAVGAAALQGLAISPTPTPTPTLRTSDAAPGCGFSAVGADAVPAAAADRIAQSRVAVGTRNVRFAWLGSATDRYAHAALGSRTHAASLHAVVATASGDRALSMRLPDDRVFEDRLLRLVDLDGDGSDEIVVVESQARSGASLVVYGVDNPAASPRLAERARSEPVGFMRWLNPVGAADVDGDGRLDLVGVTTPHVGGVLTLYRYDPPRLVPLAREGNVSNHRFGATEQRLAAIVARPGHPTAVLVPDQSYRSLRLLGWRSTGTGAMAGAWHPFARSVALPAAVERIDAHPGGACVALAGGGWVWVSP